MMETMRSTGNRNVTQAIVILLLKLRSGNSNNCLFAILDIREDVAKYSINTVLRCFETEILPAHLVIQAYRRNFFIDHSSEVARHLHNIDNQLALICDAIYLHHEKNSKNAYQRKSYSGQKKTANCMPFNICTTDGFIVDVAGPFEATKNDAQILKYLLEVDHGLRRILQKGDIFVLDYNNL